MQFIELLCPIHNSPIQFLNIKTNVPKGERVLCSKCTLNEPLDLEDSFKLWKNFQNSQTEKLTQENTVHQLIYLSKQLSQLNSQINKLFHQIQQEIHTLTQEITSLNQDKINHVSNLDIDLNLSKLQEIASLLSGDQQIQVVDISKYITNLHLTIVYNMKEIILEEKSFLSQLEFEIISAKRTGNPNGQFVDYTIVENTLKQEEKCCALTFTFDNSTLVAGYGNKIKLYKFENQTLQESSVLEGHSGKILCLNSSKKNYMFISGSEDKFMKCWRKECGLWKCQYTLVHPASVFCQLLSNDDNLIIGGGADGTITIWNNYNLTQTFAKHNGRVLAMSLNDSQNQFVSCSNDKKLIIWILISNDWKQKQAINMEDKGFRISYIGDNMIAWQQFKIGTTFIFEEKDGTFEQTRTIELIDQQDGQCLFPSIYNKDKSLLIQKHSRFVYIFVKLTLFTEIECESDFVYGTLSRDGQYLVLWDECTQLFKIIRLNYQ